MSSDLLKRTQGSQIELHLSVKTETHIYFCWDSGHATSNTAPLHIEYFKLKECGKTAEEGR